MSSSPVSRIRLATAVAVARADPLFSAVADEPASAALRSPDTAAGPSHHMRLLGAMELRCGARVVRRFPSRAVAALMGRLALQPERAHAREELVELLWPGAEREAARNRLRQALSTLKTLLNTEGVGDFVEADRTHIRVRAGALSNDVLQFEQHLRAGRMDQAHAAYGGELMPGHYEEWVIEERQRLAGLFERIDQQVLTQALRALPTAQALHAVTPPASGLPHYWTTSVGSEWTASRLSVLVRAQRLVTVHGPGGSGKTRLAVEVARALHDEVLPGVPNLGHRQDPESPQATRDTRRFDRVSFVPLLDCVSAAQTLDAICKALQLEADGGQTTARIAAALAGGRSLLLLDNLEQIDSAACQVIADMLACAPSLHVMATSRLLLDLDGEQAFELDGLVLPPSSLGLEEAANNPSLMLLLDRARAAKADFRLNSGNVQAACALVRLLGGMPLAIELAASRLRSMSVTELLQRLSEDAGTPMLDLLTRSSQRASVGSRHASMRHVLHWSWRQLRPEQVALMQDMAVLGAPARLAMVAAVAGLPLTQTATLLSGLCDACLVRSVPADAEGAEQRYEQQQPVREFASEAGSQASADTVHTARQARQRLRRWLQQEIHQALAHGQAALAAVITPEMAHLHAAIISAPDDGAPGEALELALPLRSYWERDVLPASCAQALLPGLQGLSDAGRLSDAHELLAQTRSNAGDYAAAEPHAQAAIAAAKQLGDDRRLAMALTGWVWAHYHADASPPRAQALLQTLEEARALAERSGDARAIASTYRTQATMICNFTLDYARSEKLVELAQPQWERAGDSAMARRCLLSRALMWAWQKREEQALPVMQQCEAACRSESDWVGALLAARQTGRILVRLRHWPAAVETFSRALNVGWQRRYARGLANTLLNMPEALFWAGQTEAAAQLQGFAVAHWEHFFGVMNRIEWAEQRRLRRLLRLRMGAAAADVLRLQGAALDLPRAVELAQASATRSRMPGS